jgi:hypothetical protein
MKRIVMVLSLMLGVFSVLAVVPTVFAEQSASQVRHLVVFKYKPTATEAEIREITNRFGR